MNKSLPLTLATVALSCVALSACGGGDSAPSSPAPAVREPNSAAAPTATPAPAMNYEKRESPASRKTINTNSPGGPPSKVNTNKPGGVPGK